MKNIIKLYRFYLNILAVIAPKYGGKVAFNLFQRVSLKTIKEKELPYYDNVKHFKVKLNGESLHCYETGNVNGKLVFLVHGWNSNAGSLTKIALALATQNYRVISFDLPGHASTKEKRTNLYICKEAFKTLIKFVNPTEAFDVISHSFGSIVSAYALSETTFKTNKLVILSSNNKLEDVFLHFKKMIQLNDIIYASFKVNLEKYMNESVEKMITADKLNNINFENLLLIHDKFDKVIPFSEAETIHNSVKNSVLIPFEKIGHYRMLWNDDVVRETVQFIKN